MKKSKLYGSRLIEDNKLTITPELVTLESTDDVTNLTFDRGNILDAASVKLYLTATSDDLITKYNTLSENVTTNSNDIITINTLLTTTAESINSINANITTINNSLVDYGIALEYVDNKLILKNKNSDTLSSIDLSTMTEDTYLDTVTFSNNKLIFTWNEGSSKQPITIDLSRLKDKDGNELSVGNILAKSKLLFLSKNDSDTAKGLMTFMLGIRIGDYTSETGGVIDVDKITGLTYLEVDKLKVRMKAYFETLSIVNELSIAGKWTISPGGSILCTRVNITAELNYKCYFTNILDNVQIENKFAVNDLAISKDFNIKTVEYQSVTNHYYWRKVLEVGEDYIVLSKTDCDTGSDAPNVGDVICQLGNTTDISRLNALVFSSVDEQSPCINLYSGINSYSLANKEYVSYGVDKTTNKAFMNVYGDMYFGDRPTSSNNYEGASYIKYDSTNKKVTIKGELDVTSTVGGTDINQYIRNNSMNDGDVNSLIANSTVISDMLNLIDGAIETYFYTGVPTLSNMPASGWVEVATETNKETYANHVGDLYYDKDTGKAYRFMKDGNTGIYSWVTITDVDITKALADSSEALLTANVKRRIFYGTPTPPYDKGDLWVEATYPVGTTKTDAVNNLYYSEILYCNTAKALGSSFAITDWKLSNNYTGSINTVITDLNGYKYIKDALLNDTLTSGGLILSSLIALRDSSNNIQSGINGILNPEATGKGIATWWGGKMIDGGFAPNITTTTITDYATSLIRFDGSGYLANGNISWDTTGKVHANPLSFFVGSTNIGIISSLFSTIPTDVASYSQVTKIHPTKPFDTLTAETINITNLAFNNGTVSSIADPASYKDTDNNSIATPNFVSFFGNKTYLSKLNDDTAKGIIDFQKGIKLNSHSVADIIKSGDDIQNIDTLIMSVAKQLATFMRKDVEDSTDFIQTFTKGIKALLVQSDNYSTGMLGAGFTLKNDINGDSYIEVDRGLFRKTVTFYELLIQKIKSVGGQILLSPTLMNCIKVEEQADSYRCYFKNNEDGKIIYNEFEVNDLARSQDFNVKTGSKYYWRKVIAIGDDYIDLSKTDCDEDSGVPEVGDDIILIGNSSDILRQGAIVLSAYGPDSPYIKIYQEINSYSLSGKERTTLSPSKIDITADSFKFSTGKSVKEYIDNNIIVPCGNWQLGISYLKNRLVTFNNLIFISTADTSDCPIVPLTDENGAYLVDENNNIIVPSDENGHVTYNSSWKPYTSNEGVEDNIKNLKIKATAAANAASAAQIDATSALGTLTTITDDNILSANEKHAEKKEWDIVYAEKSSIETLADTFGVDRTIYDSAFQLLANYLNGGTTWVSGTPSFLSNINSNTTIDGSNYRSKWSTYYTARTNILNSISIKAKTLATNALDSADKAIDDASNAANAAQKALDTATAATINITNIISDNVLSANEKSQARQDWDTLYNEKTNINTLATAFEVSSASYNTALTTLGTYLNNGVEWTSGEPNWINDDNLSSNTIIVGTTYRTKWTDVYTARTVLLNSIAQKAKDLAGSALSTADTAKSKADSAQAAANKAQSDVNSALGTLSNITSDNILSPVEKSAERKEWNTIYAEKSNIDNLADTFEISRTAYDNTFKSLASYLNAGVMWSDGVPNWLLDTNLSSDTTIDGTTYRQLWSTFYIARTTLLNLIAEKARTLANNAQTTANSAAHELSDYKSAMITTINGLQSLIDGEVDSWFNQVDPTTNNIPASEWTTDILKQRHANDTYTNTNTGASWKWIQTNNVWGWIPIADTATQKALANAAKAQDTADGKRRVFTSQPTTASIYDIGDVWVNATYGTYKNDFLVCIIAKSNGANFDIAHWKLASKYTDDTVANTAADNATKALNHITDLVSDNILSAAEKPAQFTEWQLAVSDNSLYDSEAVTYNISTEKTNYDNAFIVLAKYLNGGTTWTSGTTPLWFQDLSTNTTIVGDTYRSTWLSYYKSRGLLLNKITAQAKTIAENNSKNYIDASVIVPCGNWVPGTSYLKNRLVTFNNQTFISTVDTSDCPIVVLADENGDYLVDENGNYITPTDENGNITYNPSWKAYSSSEALELDITKFKKDTLSTFEILNDEINSKVSSATYDMLGRRVETAESNITQNADSISTKVSQTDYTGNTVASLINQTATTVAIQASKIDLVGAVTFNSFNSDVKNTINGKTDDAAHGNFTYINGDSVYTGTLTANQVNAVAIDAGAISTGILNADRIDANSITFEKLVGTDITALGNVTAGSFNIGSGKFVVDEEGSLTAVNATVNGYFHAEYSGEAFVRIGMPASPKMLAIRADGLTGIDIGVYGDNSTGLSITANGLNNSAALNIHGSNYLITRQFSVPEGTWINGLSLCRVTITSGGDLGVGSLGWYQNGGYYMPNFIVSKASSTILVNIPSDMPDGAVLIFRNAGDGTLNVSSKNFADKFLWGAQWNDWSKPYAPVVPGALNILVYDKSSHTWYAHGIS